MKIAILASGRGEKALHLHNFFKEGNRVEIAGVLIDSDSAELGDAFATAGIPVAVADGMDEEALRAFVADLRRQEVDLIVVDGFEGELPAPLAAEYGEALLYPSGVHEGPIEVIEAEKRLREREAAPEQPEPEVVETADAEVVVPPVEDSHPVPPTLEDEWAEALKITPPELGPVPPQLNREEIHGEPPVVPRPPAVGPQPPAHGNMPEREPMPDTYLVWAVIITILCCLIPGIVAIIYSSSVSTKYYAGDVEGAKRASRNAQIWIIVSVVAGIIWTTLYLPLALITG